MNKRNFSIDIIRGLAILLVVLGHTLTGCVKGATESFLFQIVWSLQMPLFMLISGYCTKFRKPVVSIADLKGSLQKSVIVYLLPWVVWTFLIRGLIFGQKDFLDINYLLYHMDTGYWFLTSLWTIVFVFTIVSFFTDRARNKVLKKIIVYIIGMAILAGIAYIMGLSFFGLKLTLYYMPFYMLGYIFTEIEKRYSSAKYYNSAKVIIVACCLAVWLFIISRVNVYNLSESVTDIMLRVCASLTGCIAVAGLIGGIHGKVGEKLAWVGRHTLEIYLIHCLVLNLFRVEPEHSLQSVSGVGLVALNFAVTITLCIIIIHLLEQNKLLQFILFGKRIQ